MCQRLDTSPEDAREKANAVSNRPPAHPDEDERTRRPTRQHLTREIADRLQRLERFTGGNTDGIRQGR